MYENKWNIWDEQKLKDPPLLSQKCQISLQKKTYTALPSPS